MTTTEKNKIIAKNTIMLYIRMLFIMGVTLYTSRIILSTLGVVDFGIYNIVGGVVIMFSFLNNAMSASTQRFLSYELGRKNIDNLNKVFSMSVITHAIIAMCILLLSETVGLWFLNTFLVIPSERLIAANWVYQFSVLTFIISILNVPYSASIISHEKMNIFAYLSILDVSLKLASVFILQVSSFDKLKLYSILIFIVTLCIQTVYMLYSTNKFIECKLRFYWDKEIFKTLISFTSWNLFGSMSGIASSQGANILLNLFFGPTLNAARGIAFQVNGAINSFVSNFQTAIKPQIIKSYANKEFDYMNILVLKGSKYSFYLLLFLSLPFLVEINTILNAWLSIVPDYTSIFCRLVIINSLIESISGSLATVAQATGKVKYYQSKVGILILLNLPISYLLLTLGSPSFMVFIINIIISILALYLRLQILKKIANLSISIFKNEVLYKVCFTSLSAIFIPIVYKIFMPEFEYKFVYTVFISVLSTSLAIYVVGINQNERIWLNNNLKNIISRFSKRTN